MRFVAAGLSAILGLALIAGCGDSNPKTAPVSGKVTYKGEPVPKVNVVYTPAKGRPAQGTTDAEGKYTLSTFKSNDGAVPGEHKVAITSTETPPMPGSKEYATWKPSGPDYPKKYRNSVDSPLKITVPGGNYDINLED
jgi:hypothetical protein